MKTAGFFIGKLEKTKDLQYNIYIARGEGIALEKRCVLDEAKVCNDCGECQKCDLDPNKICDNCMKCVNSGADYSAIEIDEICAPKAVTEDNLSDFL